MQIIRKDKKTEIQHLKINFITKYEKAGEVTQ